MSGKGKGKQQKTAKPAQPKQASAKPAQPKKAAAAKPAQAKKEEEEKVVLEETKPTTPAQQGKGKGKGKGKEPKKATFAEPESESDEDVEIVTPGAAGKNSEFKFDFNAEDLDNEEKVKNFISSLPESVQIRVKALNKLHDDFLANEKARILEIKAIEEKYEKLNKPFFSKRAEISSGSYQPKKEDLPEQDQESYQQTENDGQGIPEFWLKALSNSSLVDLIAPHDIEPLKYLEDIKYNNTEDGFVLVFHFRTNPYFSDSVLRKTYAFDLDETANEIPKNSEGTKINWKPNKNVTVEVIKQRKKAKGKTKTITKEEPRESFFNFFTPPPKPDEEEMSPEMMELFEDYENDFEIGKEIKEIIIPFAVKWFTGELEPEQPMGQGFDFDDEDDEDDFDDDDDDEDDDDDDDVGNAKINKVMNNKNKPATENPPECKQQ